MCTNSARVGVCVDTCHAFAAGYDLADDCDSVWARFAELPKLLETPKEDDPLEFDVTNLEFLHGLRR